LKVSYKIIGQASWVTLFDQSQGATVVMPDFKGSVKWLCHVAEGFGAASESVTPEGNATATLPWRFGQSYSTPAAAVAAVRLLATALGGSKFHLQVVQDGETQYWPNGSVESYEFEVNNCYVFHSFQFRTEFVTKTQPTT